MEDSFENNFPINTDRLSQSFYKLLAISFAALLLLTVLSTASYAWSASQTEVSHSGASISLNSGLLKNFVKSDNDKYQLLGEDSLLGTSDVFLPGSVVEFDIGFLNLDNPSLAIDKFILDAPNIWTKGNYNKTYDSEENPYDEIPIKTNDNTYEYFGKHLTLYISSYTTYKNVQTSDNEVNLKNATKDEDRSGTLEPNKVYLLENTLDTSTEKKLLDFPENEPLQMEDGEAILLHLVLTFENDEDADQSIFMDFGSESVGGRCARTISTVFSTFEKSSTQESTE